MATIHICTSTSQYRFVKYNISADRTKMQPIYANALKMAQIITPLTKIN